MMPNVAAELKGCRRLLAGIQNDALIIQNIFQAEVVADWARVGELGTQLFQRLQTLGNASGSAPAWQPGIEKALCLAFSTLGEMEGCALHCRAAAELLEKGQQAALRDPSLALEGVGDVTKVLGELQYRRTKCLLDLGRFGEAMQAAMEALNYAEDKTRKDELTKIFVDLLMNDKQEGKEKQKNLYEILGVAKDATIAEIKKAYRALAMKYHPDKNSDPLAQKLFVELSEAYSILADPDLRSQYDGGRSPDDLQRAKARDGRGRQSDYGEDEDESKVKDAMGVFHGSTSDGGGGSKGGCSEDDYECILNQDEEEAAAHGEDEKQWVPEHCCLPEPL